MIAKPAVARYKYTLDGSFENARQLATSGVELVAVVVTGGTADIVVGIYDTPTSAILKTSEALFLGANQGESTPFTPDMTMPFKKGLYVQIEQGGGTFNGKVFLLYN